jgi:ankyrin repeat protein
MKKIIAMGVLIFSVSTGVGMDQNSQLILAVVKGDLAKVTQLINSGANVNTTDTNGWPILEIASNSIADHSSIVKFLLKAGANVNARDSKGWTVLMSTSILGRSDIIKLLLDAGADVTAIGETALLIATLSGRSDVVKLLLEAGADVNTKVYIFGRMLTAYELAPCLSIRNLLLAHGAQASLVQRASNWLKNKWNWLTGGTGAEGTVCR